MIKTVYRSSCKVQFFLSDFNETRIFLDGFSENTQISNFMTIRPVVAEVIHTEGRTDGQP
jgi:hypothetical protein